ncbi:MAG: ABC transporter permease [Burkholderiales bacterium]|nr:ABC transporter permease [Bacteroidia bacterium]
MNKLLLIIQREYFSRVKKKSFLIMTILGPVLLAGLMVVPVWLAMRDKTDHQVLVLDHSGLFLDKLPNTKQIKFTYGAESIQTAKAKLKDGPFDMIMEIKGDALNDTKTTPVLYYKKQPGISVEQYITNTMENVLFDYRLQGDSIDLTKIDKARRPVELLTLKVTEDGKDEKTNTEINMAIGFACAIAIYFMIFLYGSQVMRGVIEEKSNRIVEVIVSSVKPFQLMLGKIIGVAFVGLTQFILWIVLTLLIQTAVTTVLFKDQLADTVKHNSQMEKVMKNDLSAGINKMDKVESTNEVIELFNNVSNINISKVLMCFAFYFLFGYLLYAALFAAIGSAVDSEADTQQFILPVTIPLIASFIIAQSIVTDPDSSMAQFFSIFPLTSPIVMMVRLPFDVPVWELALSMFCLVIGFLFFTWVAGKIYRTGILMYGKKPTWKELGKWLFYKG